MKFYIYSVPIIATKDKNFDIGVLDCFFRIYRIGSRTTGEVHRNLKKQYRERM
jgi:hypothetical protein